MTYWRCGPGLLPLTLIRMAVSVMHHHTPPQPQPLGVRCACRLTQAGTRARACCALRCLGRSSTSFHLQPRGSGLPWLSSRQQPTVSVSRDVPSVPLPVSADWRIVSEAVPSTVFHQRLDPADNCSVLYPVGDNQGRTNFTQSSPRRNPCGVVWDHCRVSSEVCEVSVWSLCTRCGRVTGEVCRGTIYGIPLEV